MFQILLETAPYRQWIIVTPRASPHLPYGCRRTAKKLVATGLFGPTGSDFLINSHRGKVTLGGKKGGKSYDYGYGR